MLREARELWHGLDRPLDAAACDLLIGTVLRDAEPGTSAAALETAAEAFERLGVAHMAERAKSLDGQLAGPKPSVDWITCLDWRVPTGPRSTGSSAARGRSWCVATSSSAFRGCSRACSPTSPAITASSPTTCGERASRRARVPTTSQTDAADLAALVEEQGRPVRRCSALGDGCNRAVKGRRSRPELVTACVSPAGNPSGAKVVPRNGRAGRLGLGAGRADGDDGDGLPRGAAHDARHRQPAVRRPAAARASQRHGRALFRGRRRCRG